MSYWKAAGMSTDQSYPETQQWKTLEEEITKNSFYPLDQTQQDPLFPLAQTSLCNDPGGVVTVGVVPITRWKGTDEKQLVNDPSSCWAWVSTCWMLFSCPTCLETTVFPFPGFLTNSFILHTCLSLHVLLLCLYILENQVFGERAGMSEVLHHLISPPQAFLSQESFPFHSLLTSQIPFLGIASQNLPIPFCHICCIPWLQKENFQAGCHSQD